MPRRLKRGRRRPRRRIRKVRRGKKGRLNRASTGVLRGPSGFPDSVRVKLDYFGTWNAPHTAGSIVYQVFSGNSPFDPDVTATGHQPYAYDQWATLYNRYRCYGSTVHIVSSVPNGDLTGTHDQSMTMLCVPQATANSPADPEWMEQPYAKTSSTMIFPGKIRIKSYMSTAKMLGLKRLAPAIDDTLSASTGGSPGLRFYWLFASAPINSSSDNMPWTFSVKIRYYCEFYSRVQLTDS